MTYLQLLSTRCDLLKIHYLCGDKDNVSLLRAYIRLLWFAQNSLPLRWQRQLYHWCIVTYSVVICSKFITFAVTKTIIIIILVNSRSCDLLKIHYLCGDKDNFYSCIVIFLFVVICSKFITFAVTKTIFHIRLSHFFLLWFAQNSLPLRWQRQFCILSNMIAYSCDLLKIHYLCGDKDNL